MQKSNLPSGGGVIISPKLRKESVVVREDGTIIEVKDVRDRARVIRENLKYKR